jgi:hypothetical protein
VADNPIVVPPATELADPSPAAMEEIRDVIRRLLALNDPAQIIKIALEITANLPDSPDRPIYELALKGAASFGAGLRAAQQTDFAGAVDGFRTAVADFHAVDVPDARSIAYAFLCYMDGTSNALLLNLDRARELWDEAERHLKAEGGLQEKYRVLLEQFKPDQFYISAVNAIMRQDFGAARLLMQEASAAANHFADKNLSPEDPNYQFFKGLGQFYTASYNLADSNREFVSCGYDRLIGRRAELMRTAESARALLVKQPYENTLKKNVGTTAAAVHLLQEVLIDFSEIMKDVMLANFSRDAGRLLELRRKIDEASTQVSALGPTGVVLLRQCEQFGRQADNVERLTRPTVKDFGLFSGFVALIAFVPLLLITSWVFSHFEWGVPPITFMWLDVGVACVVGFGAGAFKLLPALMGGKSKD